MRKPPIFSTVAILLSLCSAHFAQELEVSGAIVGPRGMGVAEATIELLPLEPAHRVAERQLAGDPPPEAVKRTRTDRDGEFRLDAPIGLWKLAVRHPGYLAANFDLGPLLTRRVLPRLEIPRRSELAARLVDGDGEPVAGVPMLVAGWSARWKAASEDGWWPAERMVRTDEEGLAALPCASSETVSVAAIDRDLYLYHETTCDAGLVELELEEMRSARLIDHDGVPASGAYGSFRWPRLAFGVSDGQGRVRGPFIAPGAAPVTFADRLGYYGEARWVAPEDGKPGSSDVARTDLPALRLPPTVLVGGRAVDAFDGTPVDNVWLWIGRGSRHLLTIERGEFLVRAPDAQTTIRFGGPGYLTTAYPMPAGDVSDFMARLTPALTQHGRVIDSEGSGIAGALIGSRRAHVAHAPGLAQHRDGSFWLLETVEARTADDGTFELRRLPPLRPLELRISSPGFATHYAPVPKLEPGVPVEELVITLERGIRGFGFVVTESEMPIAGAEVALLPSLTGAAAEQSFEVKENYRTRTVAGGRFTLDDLPAGRYYLSAKAAGFPELLVPGVEVVSDAAIDAGDGAAAVDLGTVVLEPGVLLSGRVLDSGGEPVAAAQLSVRNADGEQIVVQRAASLWFASAVSRPNGSFHIDGLPRDSRLILLVSADGFLPRELAVTTGDEDQRLDVELSRGTRVSGRVLDPDGRPAPGARVDLVAGPEMQRLNTSTSRTLESDVEGRFEASGLQPGQYAISARLGATESESLLRQVPASGLGDVVLELRHRAALAVTVTDDQGESIAGVFVVLTAEAPERMYNDFQRTDGDGVALFQPLEAGSYRLAARHRQLGSAQATVDVEAIGDPQPFELRLEPPEEEGAPLEVSGRVIDPAGLPVQGASLWLAGASSSGTESGADGQFILMASPGEYRLRCRHPRFAAYFGEPFNLDGDGASGLVVELSEGAVVTGTISGLDFDDLARIVVMARGPFQPGAGRLQFSGQRYGTVDFEGALHIEGLGAGEWVVRAELLNPTRSASERIEVAGDIGERVQVDLHFEAGHRLTGSVLSPDGPIVGGTVRVSCLGEFRGETFTDDEGRFLIDHVPGGRCRINATDPETGAASRQQLELTSDSDIVLEIKPL